MSKNDVKNLLDGLELTELEELENYIRKSINQHKRKEAVDAIKAIASEAGIDLYKLAASGVTNGGEDRWKTEPRKKQYVHPENPDLVWNGKGRHPLWFKDLIRSGVPPESLLKND